MGLTIIDRLESFMAHFRLNDNQLTVNAGLSIGLIGKAKKTRSGLNADSIEKILHSYPTLSADWLLTGRGEMLKQEGSEPLNPNLDLLMRMLSERDEKIAQLNRLIGRLEAENSELKTNNPKLYRSVAEDLIAYEKPKKTE